MASKPVLLAVDDDAEVVRAVERDLRRRYAQGYRVLAAGSGAAALELLNRLVVRGDLVALLLADQRMPNMTGVEFLARAMDVAPRAKRVLLTAYADTDAAIRAINEIHLDHYLMKPWHPPEERFFPVLDDLLEDWAAERLAPEDALRVVGHPFSVDSYRLRDFLARNEVPYRWVAAESREARRLLAAASLDAGALPLVFLSDGTVLRQPSPAELAERVGLATRPVLDFYDLVIVGAGPAGLAAAVYGASEGLRTVVVEREAAGGQASRSTRIENYLGFPGGLSGADLARRATAQARRFGAELLAAQEAASIEARGPTRVVNLVGGGALSAHTVLISTGVSYRRLDAPGVDRLVGCGVYYGSTTPGDASLFEGEEIFVVGGANSAGQAALHLARSAHVTVLHRGESLRRSMSSYLVDRIEAIPEIGVRAGARVVEAHGDERLEAITIEDERGRETLSAAALCIFIGADPHTEWLGSSIARSDRGFILSGPQALEAADGAAGRWPLARDPLLLETSVPGVFVAGDVREQSIKRVASAVGEGAMAVLLVHQYVGGL